jgi:hypothetical protein
MAAAVAILAVAATSLRRLGADERGVLRAPSGSSRVVGPGLVLVVPGYHRLRRVDMSTRVVDPLVAIGASCDGVRVRLVGVATFQVADPRAASVHPDAVHRVAAALEAALARQLRRHPVDEVGVRLGDVAARARREIADTAARHGVVVRALDVHQAEAVLIAPPLTSP